MNSILTEGKVVQVLSANYFLSTPSSHKVELTSWSHCGNWGHDF